MTTRTTTLAEAAGRPGAATWTVGAVARLAGTSVRTLHHYDEIDLVSPTRRSDAGYRLYVAGDLERLRAVLTWRELDFSLDDIADLLDDGSDHRAALVDQRDHLTTRIDRLHRIVAAIDRELEATSMDISLTPEEKLEVFGDVDPDEHEEEARERWGDTDAYAQSQRRVAEYTKADWLAMKAEMVAIEQAFVDLLVAGVEPEDAAAMDVAERHRAHVTGWFYDCSLPMHEGLGQMYVQDARFRAHYDDQQPGLADYVSDAITANVLRQLD